MKQFAHKVGVYLSENSPTILTGVAVGGLLTTTVLAVKATPTAIAIIEEHRELTAADKGSLVVVEDIELTKKEVVQLVWKCYIPAAVVGGVTIACIIGANHVSLRRSAALASAYSITETAFKEYRGKVSDTIGKNKEMQIRDEITADQVKANPPTQGSVIFTGKGETLCMDSLSGRYFRSDIEHVRRAINELNKDFLTEMWVSINDLYYALGLANTKLGNDLGWDLDQGLVDVQFSAQLTEDGDPCLVLNYTVEPKFR